jgi:uncharacterized membrane protein
VGIFSIFSKPKGFFSPQDNEQIVQAIRIAEKETSGEVRVYVESRNPFVNVMDRASEIFFQLKMDKTDDRNAVLLYIAIKDKELALFADEGIYKMVGGEYWDKEVKNMIAQFSKENISNGIEQCVLHVGQTLKEKFPYNNTTDKNELPDEIVFGR